MPRILETDAFALARGIDTMDEAQRPQALDILARYKRQQEDNGEPEWPSQAQARQDANNRLRGFFEDLKTVDAAAPSLAAVLPYSQNPDEDRARLANTAYLASRYGKTADEIGVSYELWRDDYATRFLQSPAGLGDLAFHSAAAKEIQREKQKEETSIEGVKAALRGDDVIPALQAWQAKNLDRMPDSTEFTRGFLQARERAGNQLEFADALLKQIESNVGLAKGDGAQRSAPASRETAAQFEASLATLATMKPKDRKQVYAIIGAKAEAAGYDLKGFWSQMLSELGKGMARMGSTLETQAGVAAAVLQNFPAMLTNTMGEEEFAATDESIARRQGIGEMYDEVAGIVAGDVDPVRPVISWLNDTVETGLIQAPGAVAPFMLASAALGPYGAGALFTADFAEQNRRDLRAQGMDNVQAMSIGVAAAPLQAAAESLSNALQLGRFPAVQRALASFTKPIGGGAGAVARYVQNSTLALATEFTEEQVQDNLIVPATQEIFGALSEDVPDVDWSMYRNRAIESTPELLSILVPMALVFGGTMTAAQANLSGALVSSQDMLEAAGYSAAQANEIRIQSTPEAQVSKAREFWGARAGTPQTIEAAAQTVGERMRLLRNDTAAAQADLERRGILPRMLHAAEDRWKLTFNDGSTADFNSHAEADAARWQWATDQLGKVHLATRSALAQLESGAAVGREFAVEFKPDALTAEQAMSEGRVDMAQLERRVAQGEAVGETAAEPVNEADAFDAATLTDKATSDYLSSLQILGSSVNQFKDGVLRTTIRLYEGANVLTLVEEKLEGDAKQIVESRPGREWLLKSLREYERVSGDKLFRDVADDSQLQNDDLIEAWSSLGQSYLVGKSKKGAAIGKGGARRIFADVLKAGMAGAMNSETQFFNAVWRRAAKLSKLNREGKLGADLTEELERQLGIDSQTRIESEIAAEAEAIANEALYAGGASYSEESPGPNGETFSMSRATPANSSKVVQMPDGARLVGPTTFSIRAFHGTPHKVDKFTTAKIGTGEGEQAYGWGLYFAENEGVARQYRDTLSKSGTDGAKRRLQKAGGDIDAAISVAKASGERYRLGGADSYASAVDEDLRFLEKYKQTGEWGSGNLYTVELIPDEADFLDWDKPLSEQSEKVKAALVGVGESPGDIQAAIDFLTLKLTQGGRQEGLAQKQIDQLKVRLGNVNLSSGAQFYNRLGEAAAASEILAKAGIPGIRYLDAGSRINKFTVKANDGTGDVHTFTSRADAEEMIRDFGMTKATIEEAGVSRNFVLFDESLVKILEENGKPVSGETFSLRVTPAQDAEYMAAVEAGDMAKAQRMVDEAAKEVGGIQVFHGTKAKSAFNEFDRKDVEDESGAFFFSETRSDAGKYGKPKGFYIFPKSILDLTDLSKPEALSHAEKIVGKTVEARKAGRDTWDIANNEEIQYYTGENGFDSFSVLEGGNVNYGVFDPSQIKTADPVTRDESGNVIPLSQRFNPADNRITFSLRKFDFSSKLAPAAEILRNMRQSGKAFDFATAYRAASAGQSTSMLPLTALYDEAKKQAPALTEADFGKQIQALYESGALFVEPGESQQAMRDTLARFGVRDSLGIPAMFARPAEAVETFSLRSGNEAATSGMASDSGAAQSNTEPSPGGLTEAGASPERMIELLIERVEAIRETVEDEGLELGLRGLQDRNNNPVDANIGDVLPESFEWDDGDPTDNSLGGTAVFKLGSNTEKAIRTAVAYFNGGSLKLGPSFKNGRYQDVIFAIVGGIDRGNNGMPERFASVFEDATVFDVLRFPKENPTVSSEASMSKSSFQSDNRSVTPAQDVEYLAAVEAGDMEKAQRMVDAAAKAAGYDRKLFHGTNATETVEGESTSGSEQAIANLKALAKRVGLSDWNGVTSVYQRLADNGQMGVSQQDAANAKKWQAESEGTYEPSREKLAFDVFALPSGELELGVHLGNESAAKMFGEVFPFFAKLGKPFRLPDLGTWNYQSVMRELRKRGVKISEAEYDAVFNAYDNNAALRALLQSKGIDSVVYRNEAEGEGDSFIAFDPSQIKSADPVTYDADGNVIPLSQRFNPADDRITYSLRSGDFASRMSAAFSPFQRNPELRMAIAQVAKQRAQRLGAEWIEKSAVLRTVASIAKEQGIREALGYDERINSYLESLTPSARQELEFEPAALDDDPLVSAMLDYGKLMSQSTAKKAGKVEAKSGDYDGAPWLPPAWYSKGAGIMPDQMAQAMFDAGLLPDAFTGTLWAALESRIASTKKNKTAHREAVQAYNAAKRTARAEAKAEAEAWAKQTRKAAGSPKAQRDMLKAALRTLDGILSAAPPEVRARVGGYVKLAGLATDEAMLQEIERRIEKLNVELEKWLKKEGVAEIQKLLKRGRPEAEAGKRGKGKDADMHALFAAAERAIPMTAEAVAGELARLDTLIGGDTLTPEQEALAITERGIVELVGDLKSADSGRVFSALDSLREIYAGGWLKWKLRQIEKREERAGQRADFIADTGKSGIKPERDAADKAAVTLLGKIKGGFLSLSSFQEVLSYAFGAKSDRVKALVDAEREASGQYEDVTQALADEVESLFADLAGGSVLAGERLRFDMAQRTIKTGKGELSQLEAIQALLMWRQEDGRRHMEGAMDENGKPIGPWNYDQAWIDEITAVLTPEARSVMSWLSQKYAAEHPALNALYRERYGVNMPAHDNYAPITVEPAQTKSGEVNDPVSGAAISSGSILVPGSLRARSRSAIAEPDFRDSLQTFMAHTRQLEYWKAYYDLAFEASAILGNREVLNAVKAKGGEPAATALRKWIDAIAQGGFRDASASLGLHKLLSRMTGRAASVGLLGRFSTLLVQSTQLGAASVKMPVGAYLVRLSKLLTGNLSFRDAINSPFIQRRYKSAPPIVRQALEGLGVASRPNQITRATRHLGNLLSGADAMFTAGTYAMLLDYHRGTGRALGLSGAELETHAHTEAERDTEAVAQPTRMATRSLAELTSTNPLAKVSWAYASEARQKIALMAWATMNAKAEPAQFAKSAFLVFGIGGLMTQILKNLWREAKGDDDESKWSPERLALSALAGPLHGVPLASELMGDQGMLSGVAWAWPALKDIASGEGDMRDVDTLLSTMGLFNDTAAGIASLSHAGLDAAKVLENLASEK